MWSNNGKTIVNIRLCPWCCPMVSHCEYVPCWCCLCLADYGQTWCYSQTKVHYTVVRKDQAMATVNMYRKFHKPWTRSVWDLQAARHTDMLITILLATKYWNTSILCCTWNRKSNTPVHHKDQSAASGHVLVVRCFRRHKHCQPTQIFSADNWPPQHSFQVDLSAKMKVFIGTVINKSNTILINCQYVLSYHRDYNILFATQKI